MSAHQKSRKPKLPDSFVEDFHRALGQLVHANAQFDFLIGLQLQRLGNFCGRSINKFLDPRQVSLGGRLVELEKLVQAVFKTAGSEVLKEFATWFEAANQARALRNDYAHGRWDVPGQMVESPQGSEHPPVPRLAFVALDWDMSPGRDDPSVYMTLEDFREQIVLAEAVFHQFFQLTEKHKHHMALSGAGK